MVGVGFEGLVIAEVSKSYVLTATLTGTNVLNVTMKGRSSWQAAFDAYVGLNERMTFDIDSKGKIEVSKSSFRYSGTREINVRLGSGTFSLSLLVNDEEITSASIDFDLNAKFDVNYDVDSYVLMQIYIDDSLIDEVKWVSIGTKSMDLSNYAGLLFSKSLTLDFKQIVNKLYANFSNVKIYIDIDEYELTKNLIEWLISIIEEYLFEIPDLVEEVIIDFISEKIISPAIEVIEKFLTFRFNWILGKLNCGYSTRMLTEVSPKQARKSSIVLDITSESLSLIEMELNLPPRVGITIVIVLSMVVVLLIVLIVSYKRRK